MTHSYGIILYSKPLFLLYQRRDSYDYIELIKGRFEDESSFQKLVMGLCAEERSRIEMYSFKELWDDLWVCIRSKSSKKTSKKYKLAHTLWEKYKHTIPDIPHTPKSLIPTPAWGFPKGRKNPQETDIECALREFTEETGLPIDNIVLTDSKPFIEDFIGSDNCHYINHYFLATTPQVLGSTTTVTSSTTKSKIRTTLTLEATDIKWMTYDEAHAKVDARKATILKHTVYILESK